MSRIVLCYHAASTTWQHGLSIPPETIERQVRGLLRVGVVPHVTFDDAFRSVANVLPALERLHVTVTIFACPHFADAGAPLAVPELRDEPPLELATMPWEELEEWHQRGVAIESHTMTHPHLPQLGDDELERELRESKERIEERLRAPCRSLAYPFGDEDARVHRAAERAGYDRAFALPGSRRPRNRFALPRVGVYRRDSLPRLAAKSAAALVR